MGDVKPKGPYSVTEALNALPGMLARQAAVPERDRTVWLRETRSDREGPLYEVSAAPMDGLDDWFPFGPRELELYERLRSVFGGSRPWVRLRPLEMGGFVEFAPLRDLLELAARTAEARRGAAARAVDALRALAGYAGPDGADGPQVMTAAALNEPNPAWRAARTSALMLAVRQLAAAVELVKSHGADDALDQLADQANRLCLWLPVGARKDC